MVGSIYLFFCTSAGRRFFFLIIAVGRVFYILYTIYSDFERGPSLLLWRCQKIRNSHIFARTSTALRAPSYRGSMRLRHLQRLRKVRSLRCIQLLWLPGVDERNVGPALAGVSPLFAVLKLRPRLLSGSERSVLLLSFVQTSKHSTTIARITHLAIPPSSVPPGLHEGSG